MAYKTELSDTALRDFQEELRFILEREGSAEAAQSWGHDMRAAIETLREFPQRASMIPEVIRMPFEVRQIHRHSHRIIFRIDERTASVIVLRIYHGHRKALRKKDVLL